MRYCPLCRKPLRGNGFEHLQFHVRHDELRYTGWDTKLGHRFRFTEGGKEFGDGFVVRGPYLLDRTERDKQIRATQRRYLGRLLVWLSRPEREKVLARNTNPE